MKHRLTRLTRLALGAGVAIALAAPMAQPAQAIACSKLVEDVCYTIGFVCDTLHRHDTDIPLCHLR